MNKSLICTFLLLSQSFAYAASKMSASEIMTKNDDARSVNELQANAVLTTATEGSSGSEKKKDFTLWRKLQKDGVHNNTLTRFQAPVEVKNEGILMLENANNKNDVMIYLPNFKKIRRVESQQQSGSFMGSVFSYSDIATSHVKDFNEKTIREEKCPSTQYASATCAVIESTPINEDVKDRTGYSKSISWINLDNFMLVQAEHYDSEGKLWKSLQATEIKIIDATHQKWLAHQLFIKNLKTNETTRLQFSNVKANAGIADAVFTQQNLQKVN